MGLALLLFVLKTLALRRNHEHCNRASRFFLLFVDLGILVRALRAQNR